MMVDFSSSSPAEDGSARAADFDQAAARMAALAAEIRSLDEPVPTAPTAVAPRAMAPPAPRPLPAAVNKGVRIETSAPTVPLQAAMPAVPAKGAIAETAVLLRMQSDADESVQPPAAPDAQPQPAAKPGRGRFSLKRWFE
jgi:hypothetical protein